MAVREVVNVGVPTAEETEQPQRLPVKAYESPANDPDSTAQAGPCNHGDDNDDEDNGVAVDVKYEHNGGDNREVLGEAHAGEAHAGDEHGSNDWDETALPPKKTPWKRESVGRETLYFYNFAAFKPYKDNPGNSYNWYHRYREMVKKNAFSIQVACEANQDLKKLLEDGNTIVPAAYESAQAANADLQVGTARPREPFELKDRDTAASNHKVPARHYDHRPDLTWRCTLAGNPSPKSFSNMGAVRDTHCDEYPTEEGLGLRPPHCNAHEEIGHGRGCTSRLSHFTVYLHKQIGHLGKELKVLVGHFHHSVAGKPSKTSTAKRTYYETAEQMIHVYKPHLFCTDANMSLIETRDFLFEAHNNAERNYLAPIVSVAAWFPYHFTNPGKDHHRFPELPREVLGIDSMGIFFIRHGDNTTAQAALVEPFINNLWIETLIKPEESEDWEWEYTKEVDNNKRYFLKFDPDTGYPGQHSCKYQRYPSKQEKTLKDQLIKFLRPHSTSDELRRLDEERSRLQQQEDIDYEYNHRMGLDCAKPITYHPYPKVKELRLDPREWISKRMHQGTHFPLSVTMGHQGRRS